MVPLSLANRKGLAPVLPFCVSWKSWLPLKTMPVGESGVATTSVCGTPLPSYSVEVLLPLLATQTKPVGLKAMPQALTRLASVWAAAPAVSLTSAVCVNAVAVTVGGAGVAAGAAAGLL